MARDGTRTVSPSWFRQRILPANQDSWSATEAALLADPFERRRIDELKAELTAVGFDRAVVVGRRDHWWSLRPRVWDGVHRSIAAMELDVPILIQNEYSDDSDYDHSDVYTVTAPDTDTEALLDATLSLSSFRSSAGAWIQCDVASVKRDGPVQLHLPHHPDLRDLIAAELRERLRQSGINADVAFVETWD